MERETLTACCTTCSWRASSRNVRRRSTPRAISSASCTFTRERKPVAAGVINAAGPLDDIVSTYREHAHALVRGLPAGKVMAELFGRADGMTRGMGGSMHMFDRGRRAIPDGTEQLVFRSRQARRLKEKQEEAA